MTMIRISNKRIWQQLGRGLMELAFPGKSLCPVCQQELSYQGGLGKNCLARIVLIEPPLCQRCGRPQRLEAVAADSCVQCSNTRFYFITARAVGLYEGALREYLAELKYRYRPDLGQALGKLLVAWVKLHPDFAKADLVIPVPIHHSKLTLRGYNQAELIAKPLADYLGVRLPTEIISREKVTTSQSALNKEARFDNIREAFKVENAIPLKGAKVILVDDILTTGATASEVARMLLRAGALEVRALTLAVGVIETDWFEKKC